MKSLYLETDGDRSPKDVYLCEDFGGGRIATIHGDNERTMIAIGKAIVEACNSPLLANAKRIESRDAEDETFTETLGATIAKALHLRRDPNHADRWVTEWGSKTSKGLVRTLLAAIERAKS